MLLYRKHIRLTAEAVVTGTLEACLHVEAAILAASHKVSTEQQECLPYVIGCRMLQETTVPPLGPRPIVSAPPIVRAR